MSDQPEEKQELPDMKYVAYVLRYFKRTRVILQTKEALAAWTWASMQGYVKFSEQTKTWYMTDQGDDIATDFLAD